MKKVKQKPKKKSGLFKKGDLFQFPDQSDPKKKHIFVSLTYNELTPIIRYTNILNQKLVRAGVYPSQLKHV